MSREPNKATYYLGADRHGRRLDLEVEGDAMVLIRHAANQRDDTVRLEITPLQAAELCEVLK